MRSLLEYLAASFERHVRRDARGPQVAQRVELAEVAGHAQVLGEVVQLVLVLQAAQLHRELVQRREADGVDLAAPWPRPCSGSAPASTEAPPAASAWPRCTCAGCDGVDGQEGRQARCRRGRARRPAMPPARVGTAVPAMRWPSSPQPGVADQHDVGAARVSGWPAAGRSVRRRCRRGRPASGRRRAGCCGRHALQSSLMLRFLRSARRSACSRRRGRRRTAACVIGVISAPMASSRVLVSGMASSLVDFGVHPLLHRLGRGGGHVDAVPGAHLDALARRPRPASAPGAAAGCAWRWPPPGRAPCRS